VLAILIAATVLVGCGGLPTSGGPVADNLIDDDLELEIGDAPQGPRNGATQEEILTDFISAATSPQNDFGVAKQFLTEDFARSWDPYASVSIQSGAGSTTARDEGLGYSFSSYATVDSFGRYEEEPDAVTATLPFTFVQVDEQWRISSAPDGIVVSADRFDNVFQEQPLYFFDPSYKYLVPDVRWFPNQSSIGSRVVAALLGGQSPWLGDGVTLSAFPTGTVLGPDLVIVESGVATVDLTEEASNASNTDRDRMRQQISASLSNVDNVSSVVITVDGTSLSIPGTGAAGANSSPQVDPLPLVMRDDEFGYASTESLTSIKVISNRISDLDGARAATLARGATRAAVLANGGVYAVGSGEAPPLLVDPRVGVIAPSIDTSGFIWSVPRSSAARLRAFEANGTVHEIASELPANAKVVSLDVSRDGSRIILYLSTSGGPRLAYAGITRQDSVPTGLGDIQWLPITAGVPIDAAWIDDRTVATLARTGAETSVTSWVLGGPSESLGALDGGVTIVGGNGGSSGLRVLANDDTLYSLRGTVWQQTGVTASFLATQQ
jgi:hypothetical protein